MPELGQNSANLERETNLRLLKIKFPYVLTRHNIHMLCMYNISTKNDYHILYSSCVNIFSESNLLHVYD